MCTVTYVKTGNKVILTSNRDENINRPGAFEPREEVLNNCRVVYPKDPKAGGTWFAVNEYGAAVVLLNGAFEKHEKKGPYAHSRGLVVLNAISDPNPLEKILDLNLRGIEPFTLVLLQLDTLMEVRWDGSKRYTRPLNPQKAQIWSSATLYTPAVVCRREGLFSDFVGKSSEINENEVLLFQSKNNNDPENGFVIARDNGIQTLSMTQVVLEDGECVMRHLDLRNHVSYQIPFKVNHLKSSPYEPVQA